MKRLTYLLNCFAATLLFAGCMGYSLGGARPEGVASVTMNAVINKTGEPAIEIAVTRAMRERIPFDGRLKLVNEEKDADAAIDITLTKYDLVPIAYRSDLRSTPDIYRLRITGVAELRKISSGEVISTSSTYGESTFNFQADLTSSKRDALPAAAAEITKFMLDDLIEQWD